ncbi:28S ribosomal protein S29, mitochondrial-like [Scleropages formosus]|uniref:Small ribosomal subunit protein mS29 n=2 Tax=Scleropages formosus TaxID=113540 RepID=A0A0P7WS63_SCLFO|nr:28S ribosomal protein S29, mitochondrial isoform X2 [Scleropages formosus]XP_018592091.1 28S ribosomal protein S29, mitochondrial isoform X2 [Scleropages formosus]KPP66439.1 28S ribosomal protein S29, mitochondrial-like [Scleropages formosus]
MALYRLTGRLCRAVSQTRSLGTAAVEAEPPASGTRAIFRTVQQDPAHHSEQDLGQYYTLPPDHVCSVFPHGLPRHFQLQMKTFNETCVMVREPALELISHLKKADYSKPALRYLLYGVTGTGKTMTLCHALHYCSTQGWVVVHIPDAHLWVKNCKELIPSSYNSSRLDQPILASQWLKNFGITNKHFLSKIKTTKTYMWTKRESTEEGQPLGELLEKGLTRIKSSSDVMGALLRELRLQCSKPQDEGSGAFRLVVAVDGVNALWGRTTLRRENKNKVEPEELTVVQNLRKMLKNDWCGGAIITSLSQSGSLFTPRLAYLPHELLGKEGFDSLDPFIPVPVPGYSEKEFESCYQYYIDRKWLQHSQSHTEEGKKELIFLSNRNPAVFEKLCAAL